MEVPFPLEPGSEEESQDALGKEQHPMDADTGIVFRMQRWDTRGCRAEGKMPAGKQRSILEDDPTHGMDLHFPGWNSAGSVCTEALEQREWGDLPCACGVGAIPHLGGKEAPGMCWMLPGIASRVIPRDAAQRGQGRAGGHLCPRIPRGAPGAMPPKIPTNPEASEGFASPHPDFPEEQI